jgi:hypothetical protein
MFDLLKELLEQLPSLLAILVCMIVGIVRWKRHPRVSLTVLIGLLLLFLHTFAFTAVYYWIPDRYILSASPADHEAAVRNIYLVLGLAASSTSAIAFAVLVAAVFMRRARP